MKKFLLSVILLTSIGFLNQTRAQCSGASVTITNFVLSPGTNAVNFAFDWAYVQGNASIEVVFLCNGVQVGSLDCIPRLKDSTAGPHHVAGTFNTFCSGIFRVEIRIWSNPTCGGTFCAEFREIAHTPLPVSLKQFTATRNRSNVLLKWETSFEQNNSGFAIERNVKGVWTEIAFVPSQATSGNSDQVLSYSYTDLNNVLGMTQYRIRQVDFDGKAKLSEIRAVRGEGQLGNTIVYPNPSADGKVTVVFEDANVARDVSLFDMSGRTIKQWKGVTNNNIQIDNLTPGVFSLRIVIPATGEQSVEKIVVNKR